MQYWLEMHFIVSHTVYKVQKIPVLTLYAKVSRYKYRESFPFIRESYAFIWKSYALLAKLSRFFSG